MKQMIAFLYFLFGGVSGLAIWQADMTQEFARLMMYLVVMGVLFGAYYMHRLAVNYEGMSRLVFGWRDKEGRVRSGLLVNVYELNRIVRTFVTEETKQMLDRFQRELHNQGVRNGD